MRPFTPLLSIDVRLSLLTDWNSYDDSTVVFALKPELHPDLGLYYGDNWVRRFRHFAEDCCQQLFGLLTGRMDFFGGHAGVTQRRCRQSVADLLDGLFSAFLKPNKLRE